MLSSEGVRLAAEHGQFPVLGTPKSVWLHWTDGFGGELDPSFYAGVPRVMEACRWVYVGSIGPYGSGIPLGPYRAQSLGNRLGSGGVGLV